MRKNLNVYQELILKFQRLSVGEAVEEKSP
jgi:hypothetical protein